MQETIHNLVLQAFDLDQIPALVGPSQTGKTMMVREIAKELNLPLVTIIPSADLPEEIAGYPKHLSAEDKLTYLMPAWWSEEPVLLFVDELDKAKEEVLSPLLRLFKDRELRHKRLHPKSKIIIAMNPPKIPLDQALIERLLFLPFEDDWAYLVENRKEQYGFLKDKLDKLPKREISIPSHEISPGAIDNLHKWFNTKIFWEPNIQDIIISGWIGREGYGIVKDIIQSYVKVDYNALAEDKQMFMKFLEVMPEEKIVDSLPHILLRSTNPHLWIDTFKWALDIDVPESLSFKRYWTIVNGMLRSLDLGYKKPSLGDKMDLFFKELCGHPNALIPRFNRKLWNNYIDLGLMKGKPMPLTVTETFNAKEYLETFELIEDKKTK